MESEVHTGIINQQVISNQQQPRQVVRHHDRQVIDLWVVSAEPEYTELDEWWQCQSVGEIVQNIHQNQWEASSPEEPPLIKEFPGEPYRVKKPIPVKIRLLDNTTFEASFEEGNIGWSDESEDEAREGLKVEILNALEDFEVHESILGPEPKRQLVVLRNHLEHVQQA